MVTIQATFIQKVVVSMPLSEVEAISMDHCDMDMMQMNSLSCSATTETEMKNCQTDCDMMTVVAVTHFIEDEKTPSFAYTQLNYPTLITENTRFQPTSLYRPPLFS